MSITKINSVTGYGRIASGKRINRAADDAAGMAIANKLKANAKSLNVATKNTREGIHVTQIADGGYDSIMDRLQSIRELAIKSMNGTNSASDRVYKIKSISRWRGLMSLPEILSTMK